MMNKSLGNLRAFRAAVVLILIAFTHACTKTPLTPDACPGGCDARMIFPVEKDQNGYYTIDLNWTGEYLPYFIVDIEATPVDPQWRYNDYSAVEAEFTSDRWWVLGDPQVWMNVVQDETVRFREIGGKLRSKRVIGPFPPSSEGDTITIHMEVFWDAWEKSLFKNYSEKFIVK